MTPRHALIAAVFACTGCASYAVTPTDDAAVPDASYERSDGAASTVDASVAPAPDDASVVAEDAGLVASDASVAAHDASVIADDAGVAPDDARSEADAAAPVVADASAPDAGPAPSECVVAGQWHGLISGNATDVDTTLNLAANAGCTTVNGLLRWRSAQSGSSDRVVAGTWDGADRALTLHDVWLESDDPSTGWRFCLVDHYDLVLALDGDHLSGTYDSSACSDHATVSLVRVH